MALKISEIATALSTITNETLIEVSEKSGATYTTKKYDIKQLADAIAVLTDAINDLDASQISYDNTASGLTATNVQAAIDEIVSMMS